MEKKSSPCLLSKIKSQYTLQNILLYAYPDYKSILKLIKYNKNLMNKLGINIKDFYKYFYKYKIKIERKIDFVNQKALIGIYSFCRIILVIYYLHLTLMLFYSQNMANDENLIKDNHKKKNYLELKQYNAHIQRTEYILKTKYNNQHIQKYKSSI